VEGGYWGKLLKVDLSRGKVVEEELSEEELKTYLGGRGLAVSLLMREGGEYLHPFDPLCPLIIATGPLTGLVPGSDRAVIAAKSPLTGIYVDECVEGGFGPSLKALGYDALEIVGRSEVPVYLLLTTRGVKVIEAYEYWGLDVISSIAKLTKRYGEHSSVLVIGPAGENLVRYAKVFNDSLRPGGRGGLGAVMGSKGLKAIVTVVKERDKGVRVANLSSFKEALKELTVSERYGVFNLGRFYFLEELVKVGAVLCKNFRARYALDLRSFIFELNKLIKGRTGCRDCEVKCNRVYATPNGSHLEGLDYAWVITLAFNNLIIKAGEAVGLIYLSLNLGLDPTSLGNVIGWAIELFEKGIIDVNFTGGLRLRYGRRELLAELIKLVTYRRGFGALLAEGIVRASRIIGYDSLKMAAYAKGLEAPSLDPFKDPLIALSLMTSNKGADLEEWPFMEKLRPRNVRELAHELVGLRSKINLASSLIICPFLIKNIGNLTKLLNSITGWGEWSEEELLIRGKLIETALRRFGLNSNVSGFSDVLSERLASVGEGTHLSRSLEDALKEYYYLMGWDETGRPLGSIKG